ncbi:MULTISPECIES: helix-turn-helix domain-containing protein [Actinokineospora]|uniref:Transcriptional regulator n=1 Tax=Actinokineospora fastidiosa TaxID=1816 RepID=A0A918GFX8_9PSEU|nr:MULTISPECIES: AraC family transcriptional regulator [Actinokineospora]UVS80392.1 Arabinose operon regulatory protein [Actinokineospora sp. UTMC 2448]GGS34963.1 transcriptional regulator [Actinokineospora fastidiosa]
MCNPLWGRARAEALRQDDLARLRRVRDRIGREHARPLDVGALARDAGMPPGHLSRRFRLAYGLSPYAYLVGRRVERARALLRSGELGVVEVGVAVGFPTPGVFADRFTEVTGVSPVDFAAPVRNEEASAVEPRLA